EVNLFFLGLMFFFFFFQAEDGIRDFHVTGVQTCALPICDEIFGGYLYFHKAPGAREFHDELVRKLDALHAYDCLRANKSMMAWGVEARVPFLAIEFLDVAMRMDATAKMVGVRPDGSVRIEKAALREAVEGYLPAPILW